MLIILALFCESKMPAPCAFFIPLHNTPINIRIKISLCIFLSTISTHHVSVCGLYIFFMVFSVFMPPLVTAKIYFQFVFLPRLCFFVFYEHFIVFYGVLWAVCYIYFDMLLLYRRLAGDKKYISIIKILKVPLNRSFLII